MIGASVIAGSRRGAGGAPGWSNSSSFDFGGGSINLGAVNDCDLNEAISFAFWIKVDSIPSSGQDIIMTKYDGTSGYWIGLHNSGRLRLTFRSTLGTLTMNQTAALSTGVWYHAMVVVQDTGKRFSDTAIYVNNVEDSNSNADAITGGVTGNTADFNLGPDTGSSPFDGHLDEVGIWEDHALTLAERSSVYNGGTPHDLTLLSNAPDHLYRADGDTTGTGGVSDHVGSADGTISGTVTIEADTP